MLTSLAWTIGGIVLSGGGLWIAALFIPTLALLLKATLDFLRSPLGTILGLGALGLILFSSAYIAGDIRGTSTTRAEWRAANEEARRARAANEAAIRLEMQLDTDRRLGDLDTETKTLAEKVRKYERENPDRPACRATDADIRRLYDIR